MIVAFLQEKDFWMLFWTALSAIGTIFASITALWLALREPKEKIEGWYWVYKNCVVVSLTNKSNKNCILDKDSYLLIATEDVIKLKSLPLKEKKFIPAHFGYSIDYRINDTDYNYLKKFATNIYLYTAEGTVIKLKKGMQGPTMPIYKKI